MFDEPIEYADTNSRSVSEGCTSLNLNGGIAVKFKGRTEMQHSQGSINFSVDMKRLSVDSEMTRSVGLHVTRNILFQKQEQIMNKKDEENL